MKKEIIEAKNTLLGTQKNDFLKSIPKYEPDTFWKDIIERSKRYTDIDKLLYDLNSTYEIKIRH